MGTPFAFRHRGNILNCVYNKDARDLYWKVSSMDWDMIALYKYITGRGRWASAMEGNELFKQKDNVGTRTNWPQYWKSEDFYTSEE